MSVLTFLSTIFRPAVDLIDELHVSEEEKLTLRRELVKVENELSVKVLEYESKLMDAQASIITAEATGHSWLQRNWRPITMLTFLILVVLDSFELLQVRLSDHAWTLLEIGLGGYVIGRSVEKIVPTLRRGKEAEAKG